ncbi:MAG TPA: hypothetical protein VGS27_01945 [Candidatus Sulfotelmatobacter sp.]|nr:hypothetical protein [Candidatus Sulfotelmatobacter sp.]
MGSGSFSTAVSWSATDGSINSSGLFTAPASAGSATITATSLQDTSKSATAPETVTPAAVVPQLEVNIGPLWVDQYSDYVLNANQSIYPTCSAELSIRQCTQNFLSFYAGQGIRGIRFQFGLGGGAGSTPFDANGNISAVWLENLNEFFADMKAAGIENVTPTSTLAQSWSGSPSGISLTTITVPYRPGPNCPAGTETLAFYPWLPYGLDPTDNYYPADKSQNEAYYCSPENPMFWGWAPFISLVSDVALQAENVGIKIEEWDIENEVDFWNFTNMAREMYDPITDTPVLALVGGALQEHGFSSGAATFSVQTPSVSTAGAACDSMFGDSGYAIFESLLLAAETGGYIGAMGDFPNSISEANGGLLCGGTSFGMIIIPSQPTNWKPTVFDFHVYPCILGASGCDLTANVESTAALIYNADWQFMHNHRNADSNVAMIGETNSDAPNTACDGHTQAQAAQNASAFESSEMFTVGAALTVIRPWAYLVSPGGEVCQPVVIGWPTGIYADF